MKKRRLIGLVILIMSGLAAAFVIADYLELFGAVLSNGGGWIPCRFKIREQGSGKPVTGVSIRSRARMSPELTFDLSSEFTKQANAEGIVQGRVHNSFCAKRTLLFEKYFHRLLAEGDRVEFEFSHPSYRTDTRTFTVKELAEVRTVELVPRRSE
jgi:hypothetical protein